MYSGTYNLSTILSMIIGMGILMAWLFYTFAKRDSENWNKSYEKKWIRITRIVLMCIFGVYTIASLVGLILVWKNNSFDNLKISYISYLFLGMSLFLYELNFQQSPRSLWVKVRKVIAYILIYVLYSIWPTTVIHLTTGHIPGIYGNAMGTILVGYFLIYGVGVLIIWLLLKHYKRDKEIPYCQSESSKVQTNTPSDTIFQDLKSLESNKVTLTVDSGEFGNTSILSQNKNDVSKQPTTDIIEKTEEFSPTIAHNHESHDTRHLIKDISIRLLKFWKRIWKWIVGFILLGSLVVGGVILYKYLHDEYFPKKKLDNAVEEIVKKIKLEETRIEYAYYIIDDDHDWGYGDIEYAGNNGNHYIGLKLSKYINEASGCLAADGVDEIIRKFKSEDEDTRLDYAYNILKRKHFWYYDIKNSFKNNHICNYIDGELEKYCSEAFNMIESAAFAGNAKSQFRLGCIYYYSRDYKNFKGCPYYEKSVDNWCKAAYWWQEAAKNGNVDAFTKIGICYLKGYGVNVNHKEAYKWLKKGAEVGNIDAQMACGELLLEYGHIDKAMYWWKQAAAQGNKEAKVKLQKIYK